jgi:beta-lactamase regulating signal transducer with metallopeptidase domain
MTTFAAFLATPVVERLGWALVHFVWLGAAVAALFAVVQALLRNRSANSRYAAACAALLIMAILPVATFFFVPASKSARASKEPAVAVAVLENSDAQAPTPTPEPTETASQPAGSPRENRFGVPPSGGNKPAKVRTPSASSVFGERTAPTASMLREETGGSSKPGPPPSAARIRDAFARLEPLLPRLVFIWLIGVVLLSLRLLGGWVQVGRLKRRWAVPAAERWQQMLLDVARRLRLARPVRLLESAAARVPTVIGWLRPVILLPASILTGLSPEQIEALLAHELAHIRRYDYLVNLVQTVIETLLFYHPAVWWVSHRARVEREHCCDDLAVATCGDALAYARALADLETLRAAAPQPVLAATGGPLLSRIRRVLAPPAQRPGCSPRWLAGAIVLGAIIMVATVIHLCALAAPRSEPAPSEKTGTSPTLPVAARRIEVAATSATLPSVAGAVRRPEDLAKLTTGTLEIRVLNPQTSAPLAGVKVLVEVPVGGGSKGRYLETDAKGLCVFDWVTSVPLRFIAIQVDTEGFAHFRGAVDPPFPRQVDVALELGVLVGGTVLTNEGKPLADCSVRARLLPAGRISTGRISKYENNVVLTTTSADGRWKTRSMPTDVLRGTASFNISFDHYDYGHQTAMVNDRRVLLEQRHEMVMKPGLALRGRVLDREGRPIPDAWIGIGRNIAARDEYARTDADGRFRCDLRRSESYTGGYNGSFAASWYVGVCAPGFAPEVKMTTFTLLNVSPRGTFGGFPRFSDLKPEQFGPLPPPLEFRLGPGHTIRGRVMDKEGKPIARVQAYLRSWKGCRLLNWYANTDAEGRFVWTGAPSDPVILHFSGYHVMSLSKIELSPTDQEHVITMQHALSVSGSVTDTQTGKPIADFRVFPGNAYERDGKKGIAWTRLDPKPPWSRRYIKISEGQYATTFTSSNELGHYVRIEAEGYAPADSRLIRDEERTVAVNFALQPHAGIRGFVRGPDGSPLARALVVLGTPSKSVMLNHGRLETPIENSTETLTDGRFWLRPVSEPFELAALHDKGLALLTAKDLAASTNIVVSPWGRIEGRRMLGAQPGPLDFSLHWPPDQARKDEFIHFRTGNEYRIPASGYQYMEGRGLPNYTVIRMARSERFLYDRLLPGKGWFMRPGSEMTIPVEVRAGETTSLTIGGVGRPVTGKIVLPAGRESEFSFASATGDLVLTGVRAHVVPEDIRKQGIAAVERWQEKWLQTNEGKKVQQSVGQWPLIMYNVGGVCTVIWQQKWFETGEGKKYLQVASGWSLRIGQDGSVSIADVVPGIWRLRITMMGGAVEHDFTMPDIPGGRSDEPLDLGRLELKTSGWEPGAK